MADVFAVFGTLLALGIAFPGMLTAWWLLFPSTVDGARKRVSQTPGRSFFLGSVVIIILGLPITILLALPVSFGQLIGVLMIFAVLGFGSLGAAGMASEIAKRLIIRSTDKMSESGAFIRGAVILELAAIFPVIGWFIFIPLAIITSIGASTFAVMRWMPGTRTPIHPEPAPSQV